VYIIMFYSCDLGCSHFLLHAASVLSALILFYSYFTFLNDKDRMTE